MSERHQTKVGVLDEKKKTHQFPIHVLDARAVDAGVSFSSQIIYTWKVLKESTNQNHHIT
jgi:hypothetical protein